LARATKEIRDAVSNIDAVSKLLAKDIAALSKSQEALAKNIDESLESINEKLDKGIESLNERVVDLEVNLIQEVANSATNTWIIIGVSTIIVALVTYFI